MTLKERLESVIDQIDARAKADWKDAQGQGQAMHFHFIGWSGGGRNAIKLIKAEFSDILNSDDPPDLAPGNDPVEPFHYIDSKKILFRDAYGRYYFWCENFLKANGPYFTNVMACEKMREYAKEIDDEW